MPRKIGVVLLAMWSVLSIGLLAQFLYDIQDPSASDQLVRGELQTRLVWCVFMLNFPSSILVSLIAVLVPESEFLSRGPVSEWCILSMAGFVQWFVLAPMIVRWLVSLRQACVNRPRRSE